MCVWRYPLELKMRLQLVRLTIVVSPLLCALGEAAETKRPQDESQLRAWVDKTAQERQPTAAERRFDEIGWLTDIREAIRLGERHKRPVMLFTHDGRMAIGRC
jgi:hypothetical protein